MNFRSLFLILIFTSLFFNFSSCKKKSTKQSVKTRIIKDGFGREVKIPGKINHIICSGSGCLRLICYMQCQDMITGVDDAETKKRKIDARPYAFANPQFKEYEVFGEFRGHDNPEMILNLKTIPDVIFKSYTSGAADSPDELSNKVGIPVIAFNYGDLGYNRDDLFTAIRVIGETLSKQKRAEEIITFFTNHIEELNKRTKDIPKEKRKSAFIGGVAYRGPHGLQSTEPAYPPFKMVNAVNMVFDPDKSPKELKHADVAKEKIVEWDPEIIFVDLSTIQSEAKANAIYELKNDIVYSELSAVQNGKVYGVLPYNWYTKNFGSAIIDAYFIGKILYPEKFSDIKPDELADEVYSFLVEKPVFEQMNNAFDGLVFKKIAMLK